MSGWKTIIVLSLASSLLMIGVGMIVAILPERVYHLSGSLDSVSLIAALFALTYVSVQFPMGVLADRFGPKPFLVIGYMSCAVAGLVFYGAESVGVLLSGRIVQGFGEAPIWALGPAVLAVAYPHAKARMIGIYNAAFHAGLTMGPLAGLVVAATTGPAVPFLVFSALCFAGGLLIIAGYASPIRAEVRIAGPRGGIAAVFGMFRERGPQKVLTGIVLYGACYGAFVSVLPVSLRLGHGFGPSAVSVLFVVFYAAISVSQLVAGPLIDRHGRGAFMSWGMLAAALGFSVFIVVPGYWAYLPLGLASLGLGVFCVASLAELADIAPDHLKGTVSGAYYLAWGLGYVAGPVLVSRLDTLTAGLGYGVIGVAMLAAGLALRRGE